MDETFGDRHTQEEEPTIPHDLEAERAVIGCALRSVVAQDVALGALKPESFVYPLHIVLFEAMVALREARTVADKTTVGSFVVTQGSWGSGVHKQIEVLVGRDDNPNNIEGYVRQVRDRDLLRRVLSMPKAITSLAGDPNLSATEVYGLVQEMVRVLNPGSDAGKAHELSVLSQAKVALAPSLGIDEGGPEPEEGLAGSTGIAPLDRVLKGLRPGTTTIFAGRTNTGKSALGSKAAIASAKCYGPVVIFSNEMLAGGLYDRMVSTEGRIILDHIQEMRLTGEEIRSMVNTCRRLERLPITIVEAAGMSVLDIRSEARRLQAQGKCDMVVVDYVQKVRSHKRLPNREQEVSSISNELNDLAKELKVPVLILAQLSRGVERRSDKRPVNSDLRESGSLENDADAVVLIYRPSTYERGQHEAVTDHDPEVCESDVELIVDKNRWGDGGVVRVGFRSAFATFEEVEWRQEDPVDSGERPRKEKVDRSVQREEWVPGEEFDPFTS